MCELCNPVPYIASDITPEPSGTWVKAERFGIAKDTTWVWEEMSQSFVRAIRLI